MGLAGWFTEYDVLQPQDEGAECDEQSGDERDAQSRLSRESRGHQQELAGEHTEWRQTGNRNDTKGKQHGQYRVGHGDATDVGDALGALDLGNVTDSEED